MSSHDVPVHSVYLSTVQIVSLQVIRLSGQPRFLLSGPLVQCLLSSSGFLVNCMNLRSRLFLTVAFILMWRPTTCLFFLYRNIFKTTYIVHYFQISHFQSCVFIGPSEVNNEYTDGRTHVGPNTELRLHAIHTADTTRRDATQPSASAVWIGLN